VFKNYFAVILLLCFWLYVLSLLKNRLIKQHFFSGCEYWILVNHKFKVGIQQFILSVCTVLHIKRNTTLDHNIVKQLASHQRGSLFVRLSKLIQIDYNWVRRIKLKRIILRKSAHIHTSCTAAIGDDLTQRQCDGGAVIGARRAVDVVPPRAEG